MLILLLVGVYIAYMLLTTLILSPLVKRKAHNQIGGKFKIKEDPLIYILPIILILTYIYLDITNSI
ncbi:hypothetical protein SAMN04487911_11955 [Arenibacter nanhaiticus]|uniref:Uncharacterized protein n=1 Tax=Arenibacter nanhaiticus TaxID=558155 RepID=A0A1M6IXC8_9FLAO|nr:hypothetical protein SAMN04487911_11955 [Arenibacter nanhaiticus]